MRLGFVSDVHHMGLPGPVEMAQFSWPIHFPAFERHAEYV
jgi:hypothetical protein